MNCAVASFIARNRLAPLDPRLSARLRNFPLALPGWLIGWDVFCFLGHRRFSRHWSVPQLRNELIDAYSIRLSPDSISNYVHRYQNMVAARQHDFANLQRTYRGIDSLDLSIDGLQPEKGHETLYAVRELRAKRVWFAEALLSSTEAEVRRLLIRAKEMAAELNLPVRLWMSDKQDAFVKGIAAEFEGVPHLYCSNHFLRGLAKPTLDADSAAKVKMRKKVRGLREIEKSVLNQRQPAHEAHPASSPPTTTVGPQGAAEVATPLVAPPVTAEIVGSDVAAKGCQEGTLAIPVVLTNPTLAIPRGDSSDQEEPPNAAEPQRVVGTPSPVEKGSQAQAECVTASAAGRASEVVLDYCAAVRGILNDDQGGPLNPTGLRMAEGLTEVRESLQRCLDLNKPGPAHGQLERLAGCIDKGLAEVKEEQEEVKGQVQEIRRVAETLARESGTVKERQSKFEQLQKEYQEKGGPFYAGLATVMLAWCTGLFSEVEGAGVPQDNLDLERWFRNPKGHERRIHGHKHAGVRIVQEGPTLVMALDAHLEHTGPFTAEELLPYRNAQPPQDQQEAINRRKVMRKARSKKNDDACS